MDKGQLDLFRKISGRLRTCFIGAISALEESYFGDLCGFEKNADDPLTESEEKWLSVFNQWRKEVLDKGNNQIRELEQELIKFNIKRRSYDYDLPILRTREEYDNYRKGRND